MELSEKLYLSVKSIWDGYYEHPFVRGLEDGSLDIEKFKYYMVQDYLYLMEYTKIFAVGILKSNNEEDMRLFAQSIYGTLNGETSIHRSYMKRLNIKDSYIKDAKASLANTSYTNYMMSVSLNGDVLDTAVSLLSCSWSYKMIADNIVKNSPTALENEFYGEWIQGYSSKEYSYDNENLINLVDKLGRDCSDEKFKRLREIFENCSRYEYGFWDMAFNLAE